VLLPVAGGTPGLARRTGFSAASAR